MDLAGAFDGALTALARWRSGACDADAVAESLDDLLRALAGRDPGLADRYDRVFGAAER